MNNIILGDGITGYIIAACLDYNNEKATIIGEGNYKAPSILLLKYKNNEELEEYFHIFGIDYNDENINKYTKQIKIGYTNDGCKTILEKPTQDMINNYLMKQRRDITDSSMSDGINEFKAIDLKLIYEHLKKYYEKWHKKEKISIDIFYKDNVTIYNTVFPTKANNFEPSIEYICTNKNNIGEFDYVYDCSLSSKAKRYTKDYSEYSSYINDYDFEIKNYYNAPQIYCCYDSKRNFTWIDISRNATKTQLKQEDIIKYLVKYE